MIVNTAYIYMGVGGGGGGGGETPVNPNLWQDGVSNYPVVFTNKSSISPDGLELTHYGGSATFSELQLTGFNSLTISLKPNTKLFNSVNIKIEFLNSTGQLLGTETAKFEANYGTESPPQTVNIPSSAKIQNAKIKITDTSKNIDVTLSSALLS